MRVLKKYWFLVFAMISLVFLYRFIFVSSYTMGKITNIKTERFMFTDLYSKVYQVEFIIGNSPINSSIKDHNPPFYFIGDVLPIIYETKNPENIRVNESSVWLNPLWVWLIDLFLVSFISIIVKFIKRKHT